MTTMREVLTATELAFGPISTGNGPYAKRVRIVATHAIYELVHPHPSTVEIAKALGLSSHASTLKYLKSKIDSTDIERVKSFLYLAGETGKVARPLGDVLMEIIRTSNHPMLKKLVRV